MLDTRSVRVDLRASCAAFETLAIKHRSKAIVAPNGNSPRVWASNLRDLVVAKLAVGCRSNDIRRASLVAATLA
jgi:hypothetical protein